MTDSCQHEHCPVSHPHTHGQCPEPRVSGHDEQVSPGPVSQCPDMSTVSCAQDVITARQHRALLIDTEALSSQIYHSTCGTKQDIFFDKVSLQIEKKSKILFQSFIFAGCTKQYSFVH